MWLVLTLGYLCDSVSKLWSIWQFYKFFVHLMKDIWIWTNASQTLLFKIKTNKIFQKKPCLGDWYILHSLFMSLYYISIAITTSSWQMTIGEYRYVWLKLFAEVFPLKFLLPISSLLKFTNIEENEHEYRLVDKC